MIPANQGITNCVPLLHGDVEGLGSGTKEPWRSSSQASLLRPSRSPASVYPSGTASVSALDSIVDLPPVSRCIMINCCMHPTLRYLIDLRSFLHGEKAGTYTADEPFNLLARKLYHGIRRRGLLKYWRYSTVQRLRANLKYNLE